MEEYDTGSQRRILTITPHTVKWVRWDQKSIHGYPGPELPEGPEKGQRPRAARTAGLRSLKANLETQAQP